MTSLCGHEIFNSGHGTFPSGRETLSGVGNTLPREEPLSVRLRRLHMNARRLRRALLPPRRIRDSRGIPSRNAPRGVRPDDAAPKKQHTRWYFPLRRLQLRLAHGETRQPGRAQCGHPAQAPRSALRFRRGPRGTGYTSSGSAPRPRESRPRLCETPPTHCETPPTHCESDLTPWRNGQPCRIVAGRPHQAPQARHRSGVDSSRNRRSLWTVARRSSSLR